MKTLKDYLENKDVQVSRDDVNWISSEAFKAQKKRVEQQKKAHKDPIAAAARKSIKQTTNAIDEIKQSQEGTRTKKTPDEKKHEREKKKLEKQK